MTLQQYRELDAAGKLVHLKAGIGDIVYAVFGNQIVPMQIQYIYINSKHRERYHAAEAVLEKNFRRQAFGRDVFLSQADAEEAVIMNARRREG